MRKIITRIISLGLIVSALTAGVIYGDFWGGTKTAFAVGDLTIDWGVPEGQPIFVVNNFAPGATESRTVQVTNGATSSRPLGVRGVKTAGNGLSDALQIVILNGATPLYGAGSPTGPKTLTNFFADSSDSDGIPLLTLTPGATANLTFSVTFAPATGNSVQGESVTLNITLGLSIPTPAACDAITFSGPPIFGTQGGDNIRGTSGNDLIFGLEGGDSIRGGNGSDCIVGGAGGDNLRGENGNDVLAGEAGGDNLDGENGDDQLSGGEGSDSLRGGNGVDILDGDGGSDTLRGDSGNDTLRGGPGNDGANGGSGFDTCQAEGKQNCEA